MDTSRWIVFMIAVAVLLAGIWLMGSGHRHDMRRDRRAEDQRQPR